MREHVVVVVYGRPGVGKSRCLIEFCLREMTVAPVSIMCSRNVTARYLLSKLAESLRLYDGHSTAVRSRRCLVGLIIQSLTAHFGLLLLRESAEGNIEPML